MIRLGPFTSEINEIVEFVSGTGLLASTFVAADYCGFSAELIHVFDEENVRLYRDPDLPQARILNWDWGAIKASNSVTLDHEASIQSGTTNKFWHAVENESRRLGELIAHQVSDVLPEDDVHEIQDDIHDIMIERMFGIRESTFQKLWEIYKKGGYPCGWWGDFPDGGVLVFARDYRSPD